MAGRADFTEEEWDALQKGVTGSGMLVSVAHRDFTDSFGEAKAIAKDLAANRENTSSVDPADSGTFMTPDMPPLWNMGMAHAATSSPGSNAYQVANWTVFATMFRCVSIAPFGAPVVPPV